MSTRYQPHGKGSIANRSPAFAWMNSALAIFMILSFITVYGVSIYQLDWWKDYFFSGTHHLSDSCRLAAIGSDSASAWGALQQAPLQAVTVPHKPSLVREIVGKDYPYYHMHYQCDIDTSRIALSDGVVYLHTGWVVADEANILINHVPRANFRGTDKPAIPLTKADLSSRDFRIDIYASSKAQSQIGLASNQPMVLGIGATVNARVLGIETSLRYIRSILHILPMLTLGMILVFGWSFGIRIRLMLPAFMTFTMLMIRFGMLMFSEFIPLNFATIQRLQEAFSFGANMGFILFGMELLSIYPRRIYLFMRTVTLAVIGISGWIVYDSQFIITDSILNSVVPVVTAAIAALFAIVAYQKWNQSPGIGHWRKIRGTYVGMAALFALALCLELWFRQTDIPIRPTKYLSLAMPLFIGGTMLFTLALFEVQFRIESAKRAGLETALVKYVPQEVAELAQDQVTPDLGGQRKMISCLFIDIQGFTPICNRLQPEETIHLLNVFFTEVQEVVSRHHGYIENFLGDGAMATWGSTKDSVGHAGNAVAAVLEIFDRLYNVNATLASLGLPSIVIRAGIHHGEAVVGNVGAESRMVFTSIGPVVNVASRLEGLCKEYKTALIISRDAYEQCAATMPNQIWSFINEVPIRGVSKSLNIAVWRGVQEEKDAFESNLMPLKKAS